MKLTELIRLAEAAELGLPQLELPVARELTQAAIDAAYLEAGKRRKLRDLNKESRPARTVRREAIRKQLLQTQHKVRLTRCGQWHVQQAARTGWLLFALSDSEAENLLNS